jgi:hypothetical protein
VFARGLYKGTHMHMLPSVGVPCTWVRSTAER